MQLWMPWAITLKLDAGTMKSILDGVTMGITERVDTHNPVVGEADEEIIILARATLVHVNLHVTDWVTTHQEDPIFKTMIKWISNQKVQDLKHLLGDDTNTGEEKTILHEQKKLRFYQGALYHHHTPTSK